MPGCSLLGTEMIFNHLPEHQLIFSYANVNRSGYTTRLDNGEAPSDDRF
jgi:hypothetical protein